jgi:hypothetical protein
MKAKRNTIELTNTKLTRHDFLRMKSLLACVSTDPTRTIIQNVLVEAVEEGGIRLVATDGTRLRTECFDLEAIPGCYDIKVVTAKLIFLVRSKSQNQFPNWRQVIPALDQSSAHVIQGTGKNFVLWASSGLGCLIHPGLLEIPEYEPVTLYIQKQAPQLSPVVVETREMLYVQMPMRIDDPWVGQLERIREAA